MLMESDLKLINIAYDRRLDVLEMVKTAGTGHIGGSMSCMDILVTLYYGVMDTDKIKAGASDRDRFILSKGHCAEALYAVLADKGMFSREALKTYAAFDTVLAEHPTMKVPGVESATGALGHGLSVGVGMCIGLKSERNNARVYVLTGDGELAEGSIWEAAMSAAKYKLDNLTVIIDRNRLQISGKTEDVMPLGNLAEKFRAFEWEYRIVNGHKPDEIIAALKSKKPQDKPLAVIANTVKGYGSEIMENIAEWHHLVPNSEEYNQIKTDLIKRRNNCG